MAKLYAELTSDKGGRVVGRGGEKHISIEISNGNYKKYLIVYRGGDSLTVDTYHASGKGIEKVQIIK